MQNLKILLDWTTACFNFLKLFDENLQRLWKQEFFFFFKKAKNENSDAAKHNRMNSLCSLFKYLKKEKKVSQ